MSVIYFSKSEILEDILLNMQHEWITFFSESRSLNLQHIGQFYENIYKTKGLQQCKTKHFSKGLNKLKITIK